MSKTRTPIRACAVPPSSLIASRIAGASFYDSYGTPLHTDDVRASAAELTLRVFSKVPRWIEFLMRVRNGIVGLIGLKNQSTFQKGFDTQKPAQSYQPGDRVGLFTVLHVSQDEFIMGDDDKHLQVQISVCKAPLHGIPSLLVTTVVHEHNWLGWLYMVFVGPAHRVIAPATLRYGYGAR